jgi:hypothetical protein
VLSGGVELAVTVTVGVVELAVTVTVAVAVWFAESVTRITSVTPPVVPAV